jgi:Ala-tRNA(Pro) deacylase
VWNHRAVASEALTGALDDAGVDYELLDHAPTQTAAAEADALGLSPDEVAKTLIVTTPSGPVRAVIPASSRIDLRKLAEVQDTSRGHVELASESDLARDYPEFELGAVPPVGGARHDAVVIDRRLAERDALVVEAGTHAQSLRLKTSDFVRAADAKVADICQD